MSDASPNNNDKRVVINDFNRQEFVDKISEWMRSKNRMDYFHCYLTDDIFGINAEGFNTSPYDSLEFLISSVPQVLKREIGNIGYQTMLQELNQQRSHVFYQDHSTAPDVMKLKSILAELEQKQTETTELDENSPRKR